MLEENTNNKTQTQCKQKNSPKGDFSIHGIPCVKKVFIEIISICALLYLMKYFILPLK